MPACTARAAAVRALSPVSIVTPIPRRFSVAMTSGTSGRSSSRTPIAPTGWSLRWMMTTVIPSDSIACTSSASVPASSQRGLPTARRAPSRVPTMPWPAVSRTSVAAGAPGTALVIAAARGCVLWPSRLAAHASTPSWVAPVVTTWVTVGLLRVRVPVLSTARWRMPPNRSNAAPDFTTTPNFDAAPMADTTVTGTAIARAHGDAATSTTRARVIHTPGSPLSSDPSTPTSTARIITPGTRGRAMRSARRARSPFSACACSTSSTIVVSELPVPAAVASTSRTPVVLIDPADTSMPGSTSTGIDSPVIADVSRLLRPARTMPSVAIRSPGRTTSTSPTRSSFASTSVVASPPLTSAVSGTSFNSARSPARARSMALSSSASAMEYKNASAAASST